MKAFASIAVIPLASALLLAFCAAGAGEPSKTSPWKTTQNATAAPFDQSRFGFRQITDNETGIALRLPFGILGPAQKSAAGTLWATADHRLKIAALNFRNKKTLLAVYQAIRDRPGRTVSKNVWNGKSFELQGRDQDGSSFYVRGEERDGEVHGLSITCEKTAGPELISIAQIVLQSFRGFSPVTDEAAQGTAGPEPAAKRNASCADDAAKLSRIATGVSLNLEGPGRIHAGESVRVSWEASERFPAGTPVYAILAVTGEARIEVQRETQSAQDDAGAAPASDTAILPGFIALRPSSPGPDGIGFGSGTTRVFIPLYQAGSHLNGSFAVRLYDAGAFTLKPAIAAKGPCGESVLKDWPEHSVAVVPAGAEIVVQDPYDIAVPKTAILSNDGRYLLQVFEGYYRVYNVATGAKLIDRPGQDPNFSPTSRFVAANTGAGESYEIIDLVSRQPVATMSGLLIAWAEDDAYVIAASAGNWAPMSVRPALISSAANAEGGPSSPEAEDDGLSIFVKSRSKNTPAWEAFGIRIDADAGLVAFSDLDWLERKDAAKKASVYELASGQEAPGRPLEKGWHARQPVHFSHIFNFVSNKTYNADWAKEQAKSKVLKELRPLLVTHKVLDRKALAELRKSPGAKTVSADWRAARTLGQDFKSEGNYTSFASELSRFGILIAGELPRQEFLPVFSAVRRSVGAEDREALSADPRVQNFTSTLKERLLREVPAAKEILKEGMLSDKSIDLASHLAGAWRWQVQGQPLWLLQGIDNQGSGGFAQINSWILKGQPDGGKVEAILNDMPEDYNPHITDVDDNAIRLKARLFFDRYLLVGMSGPKLISVIDLQGQSPAVTLKNIPQADLLADVRLTQDARHVIQINSDSQFFLHDIAAQKMVLAGRYADGEIVFYTPEGYYWSSYEGAHFVQLRFPGLSQLASFRQFDSVLNRPDLVRGQLEDTPPVLPQPELTPPPSLDLALADEPAGAGSGAGQENQLRIRAQSDVGLERLRLYYDGQLVRDQPLTGKEFQGIVSVPRSPHARWLTALAADPKGVVSAPRALRLKPDGGGTNTLYAVLAGVDKYSSPGIDLTYAKSDAARLAAALKAGQKIYYARQDVEVLGDGAATAQSIAAALERAAAQAAPEDTILFFFAGHGVQGKDGRYYLASSDIQPRDVERTGLPWSQIAAILGKTKARAVVILDACHSGLSGAEGLATNDDAVKGLLSGSHAPVLVLAASKGREVSFEGGKWQGGVFTYALTKVLLDAGAAQQAIDVSDLYRKLREILARETNGQQTPWLARQDLIGDFALF